MKIDKSVFLTEDEFLELSASEAEDVLSNLEMLAEDAANEGNDKLYSIYSDKVDELWEIQQRDMYPEDYEEAHFTEEDYE